MLFADPVACVEYSCFSCKDSLAENKTGNTQLCRIKHLTLVS